MFSPHWLYAYSILRCGCHHFTKHTIPICMVISFFGSNLLVVGAPKVIKYCLDFPFYSQLPYLSEETCFPQRGSSVWEVLARLYWDLLTSGRYQPACHYFFKVKKSRSALCRKRTWVHAFPWFFSCSLGQPASGTDLKSQLALLMDKFYFRDDPKAMWSNLGQW
jgi:hypothetical protein